MISIALLNNIHEIIHDVVLLLADIQSQQQKHGRSTAEARQDLDLRPNLGKSRQAGTGNPGSQA